MSSQLRLAIIDERRRDGRLLHADLRAAPGRGRRGSERPRSLARESTVRVLIVAGEPGGSIPATRERIEQSWGARVIDHHGLTEVGPLSFECWEAPGFLHLNEGEYICEVLDPGDAASRCPTASAASWSSRTWDGRASPVIRYRTGDIVVRRSEPCACGRTWARLEGGVLARADDMVNIRGVNVYPAAIESVVRALPRGRRVPVDGVAQPRRDARAVARDRAGGGPRATARPSPPRWRSDLREALG